MQLDRSDPRHHAVLTETYGAITRRTLKWYPDHCLCKRMNVANPYPFATFVGCPDERRLSNKSSRRFRHRKGQPSDENEFTLFAMLDMNQGKPEEDDSDESEYSEEDSNASKQSQDNEQMETEEDIPTETSVFSNIFDAYEKGQQMPRNERNKVAAIESEPAKSNEGSFSVKGPSMPSDSNTGNVDRKIAKQMESASLFKSIFASDEEPDASSEEEEEEIVESPVDATSLLPDKTATTEAAFSSRDLDVGDQEADDHTQFMHHKLFSCLFDEKVPVLSTSVSKPDPLPAELSEVKIEKPPSPTPDMYYGPAQPTFVVPEKKKKSSRWSEAREENVNDNPMSNEALSSAFEWLVSNTKSRKSPKQKKKKKKEKKKKSKKSKKHKKHKDSSSSSSDDD